MKTPFYAVAIAALLAGHAVAGDKSRSDMHGDMHADMRADKDGDGRVSRAEAEAAATERTRQWFDKFDQNKDGYVTPDELRQGRDARRGEAKGKFDEQFKAADTNSDGQLSLDEAQAKMPKLAERFDKIDKDKNGLLTQEEMQRGGHPQKPEKK